MADWLREILYPAVLFILVASLWVYAYAESLHARLDPEIPPLTHPRLIDSIRNVDDVANQADVVASIPIDR